MLSQLTWRYGVYRRGRHWEWRCTRCDRPGFGLPSRVAAEAGLSEHKRTAHPEERCRWAERYGEPCTCSRCRLD